MLHIPPYVDKAAINVSKTEPRSISFALGKQSIPTLYVNCWWPLFLALKFTFLFLNLAIIHIFIPKFVYNSHFYS